MICTMTSIPFQKRIGYILNGHQYRMRPICQDWNISIYRYIYVVCLEKLYILSRDISDHHRIIESIVPEYLSVGCGCNPRWVDPKTRSAIYISFCKFGVRHRQMIHAVRDACVLPRRHRNRRGNEHVLRTVRTKPVRDQIVG